MLTRISEIRTQANLMEQLAQGANPQAATLAQDARQHLDLAEEAIGASSFGGTRRGGGWVDRAVTNTNAAACLVIRYAPLHEVQAVLPDLVAIIDEQLPAGDLRTLDHEDPSTVYLSRRVHGKFRLEVWTTRDGGATWSSSRLTGPSAASDYRPISPRGQRGDSMNVIWMHGTYPSFTEFRTGLRTQVRASNVTQAFVPGPSHAVGLGEQTAPVLASVARSPGDPSALKLKPAKVVSTTRVMADPHPRAAPIPVSEQAEAAD